MDQALSYDPHALRTISNCSHSLGIGGSITHNEMMMLILELDLTVEREVANQVTQLFIRVNLGTMQFSCRSTLKAGRFRGPVRDRRICSQCRGRRFQ